jgi:uncharacterized membrane protein YqjE
MSDHNVQKLIAEVKELISTRLNIFEEKLKFVWYMFIAMFGIALILGLILLTIMIGAMFTPPQKIENKPVQNNFSNP